MSAGGPGRGVIAEINVTPMADVMIVLLIIFMLVAPAAPRALGASLPRPSDGPVGPTPQALVLEVREGDFALNRARCRPSRTSTGGCAPPSRPAATGRSS